MARNSCCISPGTTKSVLMQVFLCLPENSSDSFLLMANLCWGSGVDILLLSTQLHHGTQANFPLLIVPWKLNISVVDYHLSNWGLLLCDVCLLQILEIGWVEYSVMFCMDLQSAGVEMVESIWENCLRVEDENGKSSPEFIESKS